MDKPLSHSGYKKFLTCPRMYYEHYVLDNKSEIMSSALVFGSALDNALNHLLVNQTLEGLAQSKDIAAEYLLNNKIDVYFAADFDADLAGSYLETDCKAIGFEGDAFDLISSLLSIQDDLSDKERTLVDSVLKYSLRVKSEIILDSYYVKVLPMVASVESTQREVMTDDGSKRGVIDTIIIMHDGRRVMFDNKTSSKPYNNDEVSKSTQLALYADFVNADYAGFIVMNKAISKNRTKVCSNCGHVGTGGKFKTCNAIVSDKRCDSEWNETINPSSYIQIIIDKIPVINKNLIVEAMDDVIKCVDNGVFPRNLNACHSQYGQKCVYFKKCWEAK